MSKLYIWDNLSLKFFFFFFFKNNFKLIKNLKVFVYLLRFSKKKTNLLSFKVIQESNTTHFKLLIFSKILAKMVLLKKTFFF